MVIQNAQVFDSQGGFYFRDICVEGERFSTGSGSGEILDATGCYVIPGLIDIHIHGCMRHDFSDAEPEALCQMAKYQAANGITALCPTTMTLPEEMLAAACRNIRASSCLDGAAFVGINLEGPFVSPNKLGAQNPAFVQPPDVAMFDRLQMASDGMIKLVALAPEEEGALDFIDATKSRVTSSLAHTTADYATALEAFRRGARQVTHLYNAMPPFSHREPGVIGAALDTPDCMVELICDNVHVHPSVVRATFQMFGDERIILVSDSMMATGLSDGDYELGSQPVTVKGNTARLQTSGNIAGSVTNLMNCLRTAVKIMGIPLGSAVQCATVNPAKAIGVFGERGSIQAGKYADLVLLDSDLAIRQVLVRGRAC